MRGSPFHLALHGLLILIEAAALLWLVALLLSLLCWAVWIAARYPARARLNARLLNARRPNAHQALCTDPRRR